MRPCAWWRPHGMMLHFHNMCTHFTQPGACRGVCTRMRGLTTTKPIMLPDCCDSELLDSRQVYFQLLVGGSCCVCTAKSVRLWFRYRSRVHRVSFCRDNGNCISKPALS